MVKRKSKISIEKRQSKKLPLFRLFNYLITMYQALNRLPEPTSRPKAQRRPAKKKAKKTSHWSIRLSKKTYLEIRLKRVVAVKPVAPKQPLEKLRRRWLQKLAAGALTTAGLAGIIYFGMNLWFSPTVPAAFYVPPAPEISNSSSSETSTEARPRTLVIPAIEVATTVTSVGRQSDGTMEIPNRFDVGGWYKYSPVPGEFGPSVIVGHVDSTTGPAVFWRLSELKPGQLIMIKRSDNKTVRYKVTSVEQFDQDKFPTRKVHGDINYAGLRLITCGGVFDRDIQRYSHNTVVFASMVI